MLRGVEMMDSLTVILYGLAIQLARPYLDRLTGGRRVVALVAVLLLIVIGQSGPMVDRLAHEEVGFPAVTRQRNAMVGWGPKFDFYVRHNVSATMGALR